MPTGENRKTSTKTVRAGVAAKISRSAAAASRPAEAEIAARAYDIYDREGRPEGRRLAHWLQAEAELGLR